MNLIRTRRLVAAASVAGALALSASLSASNAATIGGIAPIRSISMGSDLAFQAIANNGVIYSSGGTDIEVWSAASDGNSPTVTKTFTVPTVTGSPTLDESRGLAYITGASVVVMDPNQAGGAVVPLRTITGALTELTNPGAVAWTPNGALWVFDSNSGTTDIPELLRFAPGATGNVAPVAKITGNNARLTQGAVLGSSGFIAGLPGDGVAFALANIGDPTLLIFKGAQNGNVAPYRRIVIPTPSPHWLSQGVATDGVGRIYIGSGDIEGDHFGRLDIFTKDGKSIVTIGGVRQRFQVPVLPTVAKNGTLALSDALIVGLGGSTTQAFTVKVYKPLFTKPGAVGSLAVARTQTTQTVSWNPPSNPSGTPLTYTVTVKKGTKTVLSKKVTAAKLAIARSTLPTGSLSVTVRATNLGGTGAARSTSFSN